MIKYHIVGILSGNFTTCPILEDDKFTPIKYKLEKFIFLKNCLTFDIYRSQREFSKPPPGNHNFQKNYHLTIRFPHDRVDFSQFAFGVFWKMSLEIRWRDFREKLLSHGKYASLAVHPTGRGVELSRYLPKNHVVLCCDTVSQHAGAVQGEKDVSSQTKHELSFPPLRKTEQLPSWLLEYDCYYWCSRILAHIYLTVLV